MKATIPPGSFIGHVGGDDFIAILFSNDAEQVSGRLAAAFDEGVKRFYTAEDLKKGWIIAKNRRGEEDQFPVMTVSIAGVSNRKRGFQDIFELAERASIIKKKCKQVWTSCFYID